MVNKIKLFDSGLTTAELKKKLQRKTNIFVKIALYVTGIFFVLLSLTIMFYSKQAGIIFFFCLSIIAGLVLNIDYISYAIMEHCYYVWCGDNDIYINKRTSASGLICSKTRIQYADLQKYYVGMCDESFIPATKGISIMSVEQCHNIYGDYINLIGSGSEVLAVIPYTKEREQFLQGKCQLKKMNEDEYCAMLCSMRSNTPQEKEIVNKYQGYIN